MSFEAAMQGRNIVFVVGTGVSVGATHGAGVANWRGLIEDGIERYAKLAGSELSPNWQATLELMLGEGCDSNDTSMMISAASQVSRKLKSLGPQAYADWLRESVGDLPALDTRTIEVLRSSGFPILTTNYDTLIEGTDGSAVSWSDTTGLQEILTGDSAAVGHLHGVWSDPDSVILSDADYEKHAQSKGIQALQHAACSIKTLVYIGYGSGLEDPNFSDLLRWQREIFSPTSRRHYRLCLESDVETLARVHTPDNIGIESYGATHEMLAGFLRDKVAARGNVTLTSAGKVRDPVAESKAEFQEAMKTHAVVLFPTTDNPEGGAPIVAPPVLPVPYAQYVKRRTDKKDAGLPSERLDAQEVAQTSGITVVASEESGGLTTALRWLTLRATDHSPGATPIYLPFNQCTNRLAPVRSALRPVIRARGLPTEAGDPLPPMVLAVDDVHAYGKLADAALRDLATFPVPQIFIGCRVGDEDQILSVLKSAGAHPTVRYLGRFETKEVTELLTAVAPGQVAHFIDLVVDAFVRTNLPRTPMTVASIIYILLHGDTFISSTASQSSILEQYVSMLLGRGNPLEDARVGIEAVGRESVLASLAELLVHRNTVVLPELEVVAHFSEHFKRVSWKESETRLLESFIRRGLLRRTKGGVEFQHNSFVYLFAAKRATTHSEFLEELLERPLYYGRIIQVHAGLARSNSQPLRQLVEAYRGQLANVGFEQGRAYARVRPSEPPALEEEPFSDEQSAGSERDPQPEVEGTELTPLDYPETLLPLFSDDVDLPVLAEMARILDLLSSVIRDADQIEDLDLKGDSLRVVLEGWGHFISAFSHGISFRDLIDTLATEFQEEKLISDSVNREKLADMLERVLPVGAAASGINFTLKSRTLLLPVEHEMASEDYTGDELLVATALLLIAIGDDGWPSRVRTLFLRSPKLSVWSDFIRYDLDQCFMSTSAPEKDRLDALDTLAEIQSRLFAFDSTVESTKYKESVRAKFRKRRLELETRNRLKDGMSQQ